MKERILLVGEDPILLATRAQLLSEWETEIADTCGALAIMQARPVDVIIVGQLVVREKAQMLISVAKGLNPPPEVMVIRYSGELVDFDAETHLNEPIRKPRLVTRMGEAGGS